MMHWYMTKAVRLIFPSEMCYIQFNFPSNLKSFVKLFNLKTYTHQRQQINSQNLSDLCL